LITSYDLLLEKALPADGIDTDERGDGGARRPSLFKLRGSVDRPDGLVLTDADLANLERVVRRRRP
jgi:hypothetical protein